MQKIIFFLFVVLAVGACKKSTSDPAPDPAAQVAGTYNVSQYTYDSTGTASDFSLALPATVGTVTQSVLLTVAKTSTTTTSMVNITATIKITGVADQTSTFVSNVEVRQNGSTYDLYSGTTNLGTADGTNLTIQATQGNESIKLVAKKQ